MGPKFHPQVYKKAKVNTNSSMIANRKDSSEAQELIIQSLAANEKNPNKKGQKFVGMHQVGSPFFPVEGEREHSEASRKTKAKTANNPSDMSNDIDASSNNSIKDREEEIKS